MRLYKYLFFPPLQKKKGWKLWHVNVSWREVEICQWAEHNQQELGDQFPEFQISAAELLTCLISRLLDAPLFSPRCWTTTWWRRENGGFSVLNKAEWVKASEASVWRPLLALLILHSRCDCASPCWAPIYLSDLLSLVLFSSFFHHSFHSRLSFICLADATLR